MVGESLAVIITNLSVSKVTLPKLSRDGVEPIKYGFSRALRYSIAAAILN